MRRRLLGALGLAAAIAAGPALACPADAAAKPGYVAIVISGHGTYCVKWTSGITGDAVLNKVASVGYRNDGLIVSIDGDPSSGTADDTHFWSYWHDTSSSWTYSNSGASGYDPKAGTVEGWSYDDGQSSAPPPAQEPSGLYAALCEKYDTAGGGGGVAASSSSAPKQTTTPVHSGHAAAHPTATHRTTARSTTNRPPRHRTTTRSSTTASAPAGSASRSAGAPTSAGPSTPTSPTASSAPNSTAAERGSPSIEPGSLVANDATPGAASADHSSGSPIGLIIGIGLAVVLGAGAGAVALRRRAFRG